ncbi:MlaD family protein [Gilvibacter sp.]|uniref:MlaD family protein n=1 Tax=Gilvibacter sp. TaxID=2729997 RepID=UPI003F4A788B
MKLSRELKTGILAVVFLLLAFFGFNYLKGSNLLENERIFYATYPHVGGLAVSAPVSINGLDVGKVLDIQLQGEQGELLVKFSVATDFEFSNKSVAKIFSGGLIGGRSLAIIPDFSDAPLAKSGDMLDGELEQGMMDAVSDRLLPIEQKVNFSLEQLDTILVGLNNVLDANGQRALQETLQKLNATASSFQSASAELNGMIKENRAKLDRTFTNLDKTAANVAVLSDSLAKLEINRMVLTLEETINDVNGIMAAIENGEGSMGKLLKDDELYNNLAGASGQLEQLLEDMKLNPKRYVHFSLFGKRAKQYEPAEEEPDDN